MFREPEVERDKDAVEEEVEELEKELDLNLADTHLALSRILLSMYFTRTLSCPSIEMLNVIASRELFVSFTLQQLRHIKPKLLIISS